MGDPVTAATDEAVEVVHSDSTQDHLSAQADEAVVKAAADREAAIREGHFGYAEAAVETGETPKPGETVTFGSPETQVEPPNPEVKE